MSSNPPTTEATTTDPPGDHAVIAGPLGITNRYQPAVDGTRAIAVSMIIVFHLGYSWARTGGVGVDIFFVVSGYLITSLLLAEHTRRRHVNMRRFYARRFLRLAPLSVIAAVGCLIVNEMGIAPRFGLTATPMASVSVLFYFANWWTIGHVFDMGPLGPMWSLSIEEQFYFVWPLLLVVILRFGKRLAPSVLGAICVTAIVAMGIARERVFDVGNAGLRATGLPNTELFRMIYSSFLRPDALFVGCLLAIALHVTRRLDRLTSWFRVIGPAGLAVAVGTLVLVPRQGSWSFGALQPPWALTIFNLATGVVICWLVLVPTSPFARVLSVRPLIWIGRRSYGIYVVHMFVIHAFTAIVFRHRLSTVQTVRPIVVPLLSVGIAGASYRWIESPFLRVKERFAAR